MLKSQNTRKKANNTENIKKNVTLFVSSAIGALQLKEHNLFKMLNEAELTKRNSINSITNQLNVIIEVSIINKKKNRARNGLCILYL